MLRVLCSKHCEMCEKKKTKNSKPAYVAFDLRNVRTFDHRSFYLRSNIKGVLMLGVLILGA